MPPGCLRYASGRQEPLKNLNRLNNQPTTAPTSSRPVRLDGWIDDDNQEDHHAATYPATEAPTSREVGRTARRAPSSPTAVSLVMNPDGMADRLPDDLSDIAEAETVDSWLSAALPVIDGWPCDCVKVLVCRPPWEIAAFGPWTELHRPSCVLHHEYLDPDEWSELA